MSILIFILLSYLLLSVTLYLVFPKCGVDGWKGLVPGLNFMEWAELIGRPKWWALLLFIPLVNIFIFAGMAVDLVRSFDKLKFKHTAAAVLYAPSILGYLGVKEESKYAGPILTREKEYAQKIQDAKDTGRERELKKLHENNPYRKSGFREWVESIFFAVFAAAFIRMFLVEAYVIPTPSMEGSLLVGDFLFVSKSSYGIRMPMTIAMIPLLHNRIPFLNTESYLEKPSLPYKRLPALRDIKNKDLIVFNWPVGDSIYQTKTRSWTVNQVKRGKPEIFNKDRGLRALDKKQEFITRPIDKKDHYIKRCVAIAGDSLQIIDKQIYINGVAQENPKKMQFMYQVLFPSGVNKRKLDAWGIDDGDMPLQGARAGSNGVYNLDQEQVEKLKSLDPKMTVMPYPHDDNNEIFPHDPVNYGSWSTDNYGPIWIPKAGETVQLNAKNISLYERIIAVYENNTLEKKNGQYIINGNPTSEYTFKQDYFWAMGDNRHNSEDSRAWGYVPHDHIVGRPLFIWFSTKNGSIGNGINWNRIFKGANSE